MKKSQISIQLFRRQLQADRWPQEDLACPRLLFEGRRSVGLISNADFAVNCSSCTRHRAAFDIRVESSPGRPCHRAGTVQRFEPLAALSSFQPRASEGRRLDEWCHEHEPMRSLHQLPL